MLTSFRIAPLVSGAMPAGRRIPCVLSIAGSDSGGGAGIQADLKAFAACGVHGTTAITAVTAQNTVAVTAIHPVPAEMIIAQVRAVSEDIGIDAVKIGMLGTADTIGAVQRALEELPAGTPTVLDPVMVSESGAELLEPDAIEALIELLIPRVTVLTPNVPEARVLLAHSEAARRAAGLRDVDGVPGADAQALVRGAHALGPDVVVVTGGHRDRATDVFFDGARVVDLPGERFADGAAHGSGCTHSSVLAARLAWGDLPLEAARRAKSMASDAVRNGIREIGAGAGPVDVLGTDRASRGGGPCGAG
jgi:hydroxymethylpyrimidine/phosphomethylpyrimidine kinase